MKKKTTWQRRILRIKRNEHDRRQQKLEFIEVDHIKEELDQSRMCERLITSVNSAQEMQKRTFVSLYKDGYDFFMNVSSDPNSVRSSDEFQYAFPWDALTSIDGVKYWITKKKVWKLLRLLLVKIHANQCIEFRGLDWIEFSSQQIQFARFPEIVEYWIQIT